MLLRIFMEQYRVFDFTNLFNIFIDLQHIYARNEK